MKQSVGTVKSFKYVDMVCDQGSINIQYTHKMDTFWKFIISVSYQVKWIIFKVQRLKMITLQVKRITEEREKEKREWRDECSKRSHPNTRILINIPTRQRSWLIWVNITTKISHPNVSLLVSSSSFYACLPPTKPARPNVVTLWIFEFIQRSPFCLPLYAYQARRFQLPSSFVSRIKCLLLSELGCCRRFPWFCGA